MAHGIQRDGHRTHVNGATLQIIEVHLHGVYGSTSLDRCFLFIGGDVEAAHGEINQGVVGAFADTEATRFG
jgi:hypothetical protein